MSIAPTGTPPVTGSPVLAEAARRRTFAVISHPDAGKSTLTEALALHAKVIGEAGAVHGKSGRRGVVSDWMEMEKSRGISITSAALQFSYRDHVVNLLDTPGHADFSEDTYRVLAAVDGAVMLIDAAKGLEPQTLKLAEVCRLRGVPMVTLINKWDRPGREPLELLDEIIDRLGLHVMPLNWPVGVAGEFHGLLDRSSGDYLRLTRTPGGATVAIEDRLTPAQAESDEPEAWRQAVEEHELLAESGMDFDVDSYLAGQATPVLFGAAVLNFGVRYLLDTLIDLSPAADPARRRPGRTASAGIALLRLRLQDPGRDGRRAPRPGGVRPGLLRGLRTWHGRHPRRHRQAVRHQVRPVDVRTRPVDRRHRLPGRRHRPGQRQRADGRRHAVRGAAGELSADPAVRAGTFRGRPREGQRPVQAVSPWRRAVRAGGRGSGAALGPPRGPGAGVRCGRTHAVRGGIAPDGTRVQCTDLAGAAGLFGGPAYRRGHRYAAGRGARHRGPDAHRRRADRAGHQRLAAAEHPDEPAVRRAGALAGRLVLSPGKGRRR